MLSAALHALPFPPWDLTAVAWVALVPWLCVLERLRPRTAFLAGLLWAHATHWAVAYWVPAALTNYYGQAWWFGVAFGLLTSPVFWMVYFAGFAATASWAMQRTHGLPRILMLSMLWVGWELARARMPSGAPWLLLGYSLVPVPSLVQIADLGGPYIVSFVVIFVNAALTEIALLQRTRRGGAVSPELVRRQGMETGRPRPASGVDEQLRRTDAHRLGEALASAAVLLLAVYAYGAYRLATPLPDTPAVPIAVVQGNNLLAAQWQPGAYGQGFDEYLRLSSQALAQAHPKLLIWPEAAVTVFLAHEPGYQRSIVQLLEANDADLIVGAPHYVDDDPARPQYLNSAFYLTAQGEISGRYDKVKLLPFAEYFPLHSIDYLRRRFEKVRVFTPGGEAKLLDTRLGKTAVIICFEAIFPELVRARMAQGAQVLVNLSNDVWLGDGPGPQQLLAMATLRAVENRTWMIRATTTGISAIIDPYGRAVSRSESFVPAVLSGAITPLSIETVYKSVGDVFAVACGITAMIYSVWLRRRK